jgi:hypothetical protein
MRCLFLCAMTVQSTVQPSDRVAKARARLAELRRDPAWVEQRARGTRLSRRYVELCEQFAAEVGDAGLTATGRMLVQQAARVSASEYFQGAFGQKAALKRY